MVRWTRSLPWRIAAVLTAGLAGGLLTFRVAPRLAGLAGLVTAACLAWSLRFRGSAATLAWRQGARGERRTARLLAPLERHGWAALHDLAIPGSPANIDSPGHRPRRRGGHRLGRASRWLAA